ncbi:PepSY domain-containing protein [Vibrio sp. WXL103]|uniref:PepSY domain-containing protein n=1 Tax=unclassified Vibrio TaxID=2614977 RepID=UPI003EC61186
MRQGLVLLGCVLSIGTLPALASEEADLISEQEAITAALAEVGVEVLGIRFDHPDTQWDVFIRLNDTAYEIEIDAETGAIVAAEQESLAEIQAELSGDLSHEGVEGDVDP